MAKKVLILDSNKKTVQTLTNVIQGINQNIKVFTPDGYDEACKIALMTQIDVFILDIVVTNAIPGDTSGIIFAECIRKMENYLFTPIIFITSLVDYKFHTFYRLHCFAYLEKPFSVQAADKFIRQALLYQAPIRENRVLYFRKNGVLYAVDPDTILYVSTMNHELTIHMIEEQLIVPYYTIKQFLDTADDNFIQCSRNAVFNKRFVQYIDLPNRYLKLRNLDAPIEIGATFTKKTMESLLSETQNPLSLEFG